MASVAATPSNFIPLHCRKETDRARRVNETLKKNHRSNDATEVDTAKILYPLALPAMDPCHAVGLYSSLLSRASSCVRLSSVRAEGSDRDPRVPFCNKRMDPISPRRYRSEWETAP